VALAVAAALGGCANVDWDAGGWFSKPIDVVGRRGGYSFSELQETRNQRVITANDFVDANGGCAVPQAAPAPGGPNVAQPAAPQPDSLLGGGVALGMSECDVVHRAGPPSSVALGKNPGGDRTAVLTFMSGPRPGIYHFERGGLIAIDRVAEPAPQPDTPKKKPAKTNKPNNQA
jgi:hypothetical protein